MPASTTKRIVSICTDSYNPQLIIKEMNGKKWVFPTGFDKYQTPPNLRMPWGIDGSNGQYERDANEADKVTFILNEQDPGHP